MKVVSKIEVLATDYSETKEYDFASFLPAIMFVNMQCKQLRGLGMRVIKRGPRSILVDDGVRVTYEIKND